MSNHENPVGLETPSDEQAPEIPGTPSDEQAPEIPSDRDLLRRRVRLRRRLR